MRENRDNLTEGQKAASSRICNFFCKLNILINLVDITNQTLSKFEESSEELNKYRLKFKKRENRVVGLIRTPCKVLGKRGDAKSVTFIADKLREIIHLHNFYGDFFYILFYDASAAYYYKHLIKDYLGKVHGTPNQSLEAAT